MQNKSGCKIEVLDVVETFALWLHRWIGQNRKALRHVEIYLDSRTLRKVIFDKPFLEVTTELNKITTARQIMPSATQLSSKIIERLPIVPLGRSLARSHRVLAEGQRCYAIWHCRRRGASPPLGFVGLVKQAGIGQAISSEQAGASIPPLVLSLLDQSQRA